jgi:hypothetical protein
MAGFLDTAPARFRHWSILAFGAWSAGIWLTRIRNILTDDSLDAGGRVLWLVPALVLGLGGLVALWAWWQGRAALARPLAAVLLATIVYWPVRTVIMLFGDHSAAFRLVHLVLAAVSVGLALAAGQRLQRTNLIPRGAYR